MTKILKCPLCQSIKRRIKFQIDKFNIAECLKCKMIYVLDNFNQDIIYDQSYFKNKKPRGGFANYFGWRKLTRLTFLERLRRIEKFKERPGRILDVGCALGEFLTVAQRSGWQVWGIDISNYAVKFARSKRNLDVYCGVLSNNRLPKNHFDVISMQDILEHLDNPLEYLFAAQKLLKKDGILYIVTPDVGGFYAKFLGKKWYHFKPKEHLIYFSEQTIKQALLQTKYNFISYNATTNIVDFEYLFDRLYFYQPTIFTGFARIFKILKLNQIRFHLRTGEMEVVAKK